MAIPTIPVYTGGVANPDGSQDQQEFTTNMFNQLSYEAALAPSLNDTVNEMNSVSGQIDTNAAIAQNSADAAQAAANFEGGFVVGVTSAEKGKSYSYDGEVWLCLQNTTTTPSQGAPEWKLSVGEQYVTTAQGDVLGGKIFKGSNGETVENGDVVEPGVTHLRVLVGGKPVITSMSPVSSGVVSSLTETSATIGGTPVVFTDKRVDEVIHIKPSVLGAAYYNSILAVKGKLHFDEGDHFVESSLIFNEDSHITFHPNAVIKPSANNITVVSADSAQTAFSNVFNCKVFDLNIDLDGKSGCVGFFGYNFRNNSGLYRPNVDMRSGGNNIGIDYNTLCWSTDLHSPKVSGGTTGDRKILVRNGSNACIAREPRLAGGNADSGLEIINGLTGTYDDVNTFPTVSSGIDGGVIQEVSTYGFIDMAIGTVHKGAYYEKCALGDVFYDGAVMPNHLESFHSANEGTVCIKGRNCRGLDMQGVDLQGTRSGGLYDFDASNTYCYAEKQRTASLNVNEGITTGLKLKTNMNGSLPPGDIGLEDGIIKGVVGTGPASARKRSITNGFDSVSILGAGTVVNLSIESRVFRKNVADGTALTVSGTPVGGQTIYLALRGSDLGAATVTFEGKPIQTDNFGSSGTKNALVECMYISDLSQWFIGPSYWT